MQLCSGSVRVHRNDDACEPGETVQSMAVNPNGTILAVVTQLHLHFWSCGPKTVYLTSLLIPGTSLDDNPAMFVLWRPRQGNHLAVVTARQVVFFEADINLKTGDFLVCAERHRDALLLQHVDAASRVCYSTEIRIEAGLTTSAAVAGPYAFIVTTTAGVVYVIGWHQQDVLHQWTTVGLQEGGHVFTAAAAPEREKSGSVPQYGASSATNSAGAAADTATLTREPASGSADKPGAALRGSLASTPLSLFHRVDPLQRRYPLQQQQPRSSTQPPSFTTEAAPSFQASMGVAGGIRPPGSAVRTSEDTSCGASPTTAARVSMPEQNTDAVLQQRGGVNGAVGGGPQEVNSPFLDSKAAMPNSSGFFNSSFGLTDTQARSIADAGGSKAPDQRRANGGELLSGTILHASFIARAKVLSFVFSSGAVLLCRPSCGTNFTHSKVQLQGCVTPIVSASMVAMNMRHLLLAVCTQSGALACRRIDAGSLAVTPTPLWKGLRGLQERFSAYASSSTTSSQSLGLISALEWSPSEELLCVAFYKHGVVLVHYSGAVVTHHLAGPASATLLRSPGTAGLAAGANINGSSSSTGGSGAIGCSFVSWKADGTQLWMAAPEQSCFFSTSLARVLTVDVAGPTVGCHTPLTLLADDALYLVSVSEAAGRQGVRELVLVPEEYLRDQFPLLYGAVSCDGNLIACAGRRGVLVFNRDRFSWKLASRKQEEMAFSCVADPVWLRDVAVAVPALRADTKTYELIVLSTFSVSPSHALARVALDGRPSMLSCVHQDHRSEGYVVVVDCNQVVRVFRYDAFMDAPSSAANAPPPKFYVSLTPVQQLVLAGDLASPLHVMPVCLRREEDDRENPQRTKDHVELRLLLHRRGDHSLVWIRGGGVGPASASANVSPTTLPPQPHSDGALPHVYATSEPLERSNSPSTPLPYVYRCWVDRTSPLQGTLLLTHEDGGGVVLYQLQPSTGAGVSNSGGAASSMGVAAQRVEVTPTRDTELLPLCVSPFDGYLLCAGTDTSVPRSARRGNLGDAVDTPAHPQLVLRPVLYAHRILSLLLRTAMPGSGAVTVPSQQPLPLSEANSPKTTLSAATAKSFSRATPDVAPAPPPPPASTAEIDGRVASFMWDRTLFLWLEQLRLNDTFVAVMDYFLHTALNESPPAAVPELGRRSAVRAILALVRNYPEFYAIVVGCVRKIDFTRWHLVLDFLGTPTALFRECVAHHRYAEAVHLVRVIMMGSYRPPVTLSVERVAELSAASAAGMTDALAASRSNSFNGGGGAGSLEQATQCALELFSLSIENGDYTAAYDLLRFMALLEDEIGMPAAGGLDVDSGAVNRGGRSGSGGGEDGAAATEGFLTRWLRQLTFSGAAYDDPDAAVEEPQEGTVSAATVGGAAGVAQQASARGSGAAGGARAAEKSAHQISGYPTLVLDAARCEAGHGGRSAEDAAEEVQRQAAVRHMFHRHTALPRVVHQEALRLLLTGYVAQLARLMETFSFSVVHFIHAAGGLVNFASGTASDASAAETAANNGTSSGGYSLHLHEVFDGLHKELGLPRSFYVPSSTVAATAWCSWVTEQQTARAAALPGVLSATNPKVWTVAQSVLYSTPQLRSSVESLHHLFRGVFVYKLAFCVVLMRKADLISLLLSTECTPPSDEPRSTDVSPADLITVLGHLEALLAIPENTGYKPFLQDVFKSLPPSALRAHVPQPAVPETTAAEPSA